MSNTKESTTLKTGVSRREILAIAIIIGGAFIAILNQTVLSPALPKLMDAFQITAGTAQWVTLYHVYGGFHCWHGLSGGGADFYGADLGPGAAGHGRGRSTAVGRLCAYAVVPQGKAGHGHGYVWHCDGLCASDWTGSSGSNH